MAGFSKSARAGDVTAIYQHTDGDNNGGVCCSASTTGSIQRGNRSPKCRSGDGWRGTCARKWLQSFVRCLSETPTQRLVSKGIVGLGGTTLVETPRLLCYSSPNPI